MKHSLQLLVALPSWLRPRGIRYHPASSGQSATLTGKRIFILPTRQGLLFLLVLTLMLAGAANYNNNMAFALTFMLGSMLLVSILHTYRNLVGLQLRLAELESCFAAGQAGFVLELSNDTGRPRFDIELRAATGERAATDIAAADRSHARLAIPAPRRGLLPLGRIAVESRYPLGLFRAWSYVDVEGAVLVYPRPSGDTIAPQSGAGAGEGMATPEPGSDDFHGLRGYQPGDSPRHIDWKSYARQRGLMTKQFRRHHSPHLWFDWESTGNAPLEERLSRLCRWVLDAESRRQRYGLRLPGVEIAPDNGPAQQQRCLRQLALYGVER